MELRKNIRIERLFSGDKVLWLIFAFLSVASLLVVYSSTASRAYAFYGGNTFHDLLFQFGCIFAGAVIIFIVHLVDIYDYNRFARAIFWISLGLMALIYVPGIGQKINGAYRWIKIPLTGLTFQPSDLLKVSVIVLLAQQLAARQKIISTTAMLPSLRPSAWKLDRQGNLNTFFDHTVPLLAPIVLACGAILAFNFSTSALLFGTCFLMLIIGRVRWGDISKIMLLILVALILAIALMKAFGVGRVETWERRLGITQAAETANSPVTSDSFQEEQARIAIASGGIIGKGPGNSTQRTHLPLPYSDFAYAFIAEEYGFVGAALIMLMYIWILYRAIRIARRCTTAFPGFLVLGLALMIVVQAMTNMAVAVGLAPVTGQPLPIVSKGGTSIIFMCMALGVIIGVSRQIEEEERAALSSNGRQSLE